VTEPPRTPGPEPVQLFHTAGSNAFGGPRTVSFLEFVRRRFFLLFAIVVALFVLTGFGRTTFLPLAHGEVPHHPWYVYVHAASLFGWTGLLVLQTTLVARGRTRVHRRLGQAAMVLVPIGVLSGLVLVVEDARGNYADDPSGVTAELFGQVMIFCMFAFFTLAAVALVRRNDWHKRFMAFSMLFVVEAAIGRIPVVGGQAEHITLALASTVIAYDLVAKRFAHPASVIGLSALFASEFFGEALGKTNVWQGVARWLVGTG